MNEHSGVIEAFRRGAAAAGALLAFLTLTGAVAPATEVSVGVESSMTKVHRDPAHNIPPLSERALPDSMSLEGARGEGVHGQVLVVAGSEDVTGVTWEAMPLVGPDGATIPLSVQVVGFLKTEKGPPYSVNRGIDAILREIQRPTGADQDEPSDSSPLAGGPAALRC